MCLSGALEANSLTPLAGQVEGGEGGVVGPEPGQALAVDGGRGVGAQGTAGRRQGGSHAPAQAGSLVGSLSALVLDGRLEGWVNSWYKTEREDLDQATFHFGTQCLSKH